MTELKKFKFTYWIRNGDDYKTEDVISNRLAFLNTYTIERGIPRRRFPKRWMAYLEKQVLLSEDEQNLEKMEFYQDTRGDYVVVMNLYTTRPEAKAVREARGWVECPPMYHSSDTVSFVLRLSSRVH